MGKEKEKHFCHYLAHTPVYVCAHRRRVRASEFSRHKCTHVCIQIHVYVRRRLFVYVSFRVSALEIRVRVSVTLL